ncbi:MAG: TetR/AcrR family transcriptional regulator [Spirochaetales bacterium]|nr:TetR/AcrR family transcriptional regulator [Spirochaetales bacterium]
MVSTNKNQKYIPEARNRILRAACSVFAAGNFDAARVDRIAEAADVPKSLIYYHFKNKEDILETLMKDFFAEMGETVRSACKSGPADNPGLADVFKQVYYRFLSENEDLVRVAMAESIKKDKPNPPMLRLLDGFSALKTENPGTEKISAEILAARLFFNLVPSAALICLGEEFCKRYQVSRAELSAAFSRLLAVVLTALSAAGPENTRKRSK